MLKTSFASALKVLVSTVVCMHGVVALATWDRDDTVELKDEILTKYSNSSLRLQAKTYYVRGQIWIGGPGNGNTLQGQYCIPFPAAPGAIHLAGAQPVSGNGAYIDRIPTRIVHGVIVGDKDADTAWLGDHTKEIRPWSELPSDDPWKNRFAQADTDDLCWVEFPANASMTFDYQTTLSHAYADFSSVSQRNWPTATYNGIPLHYAEAVLSQRQDDYRWTWAIADAADPSLWTQETSGVGGSQLPTELNYLGNLDWTSDFTWGLTFHGWDANCA